LQSDTEVQLKRHELDGNRVNLYFNELTNDQKCFKFFIKSETEVEEIKPSSVKLYDYYQPDLEITKDFTIPSACSVPSLPDFAIDAPELPQMPPPTFPTDTDGDEETYSILPVPAAEHVSTTRPVLEFETTLSESFTEPLPTAHPTEVVTVEPTDAFTHHTAEGPTVTASGMPEVVTTERLSLGKVDEQADDASLHQSESNMSHLANFVDVDQDLDFPDGIEGNMPVSILPTLVETSPSEATTGR
ncbi:hypothetical protein AVEN_121459-1, partial [Araneus ventricosus]